MDKNKKSQTASLIAIIVLLLIVSIVSIAFNFFGGFFYSRLTSFDVMLGEDQTIEIDYEGAYVCSMNFAGTLILGSDIKQQIYIQNGQNPLFLRAKINFKGKDDGILFGYSNWVQAEDGYVYFNQVLGSGEKIGLCKYVRFAENEILDSTIDYILDVVVEASAQAYIYEAL